MRDLMELTSVDNPALHDPPHHPADHARLAPSRNIFHVIREAGSILLMHPYESFPTSVGRFLREASEDPKVRAIKMTLYRTSSDSEVIGYLCDAARNGKQVAVVVELKARFDEAANIQFAEQLEEYGIHVTYGVVGLKTHCKVILVVRQDYNGLRRYAHIGTGNYHAGTARLYADFGLLTSDDAIGADLTQLFNFLTTGYRAGRTFKKILPAPTLLKQALLEKIDREVKLQRSGSPGLIQMKMNALEDVDITRALYRAAQAGVKIDLIVRDTCRLRPGIPGLSESVRVVQRRRALPRARAHLLFSQRRRGGIFHRLGRLHEAQPGEPGRGCRAGRGPDAAQGAAGGVRPAAQAQSRGVGDAFRRQLRAAARRSEEQLPARNDRRRRKAREGRGKDPAAAPRLRPSRDEVAARASRGPAIRNRKRNSHYETRAPGHRRTE